MINFKVRKYKGRRFTTDIEAEIEFTNRINLFLEGGLDLDKILDIGDSKAGTVAINHEEHKGGEQLNQPAIIRLSVKPNLDETKQRKLREKIQKMELDLALISAQLVEKRERWKEIS